MEGSDICLSSEEHVAAVAHPEDGAHLAGVLSAGRGRPAGTPFGLLVRALAVVVPASTCGVHRLSLVGARGA